MAQKNTTALQAQATTTLADNVSGDISPTDIRTMVQDMIDSLDNPNDADVNTFSNAFLNEVTDLDNHAIRDDTQGQIAGITLKGAPIGADVILIEDSADSNNKKSIAISSLPTGGGPHASTHENGGGDEISVAGLSGVLADDQTPANHDTAKLTSGTLDDARVAESNVTQHQAALSITESQISDLDHSSVFGSGYEYAESEAESTSTSDTLADKVTLVTASLAAGDYKFSYSCEMQNSNAGGNVQIEVLDGATVIGQAMIEPDNGTNYYMQSGFKMLSSISGVRTLKIQFAQNSTGTARIRKARVEIFRVS